MNSIGQYGVLKFCCFLLQNVENSVGPYGVFKFCCFYLTNGEIDENSVGPYGVFKFCCFFLQMAKISLVHTVSSKSAVTFIWTKGKQRTVEMCT